MKFIKKEKKERCSIYNSPGMALSSSNLNAYYLNKGKQFSLMLTQNM